MCILSGGTILLGKEPRKAFLLSFLLKERTANGVGWIEMIEDERRRASAREKERIFRFSWIFICWEGEGFGGKKFFKNFLVS